MMSTKKAAWMLCSALLVTAPLFASGCAQDDAAESQVGTLKMNLTATSAEGNTYRLRSALFSVTTGGFEAAALSSEDNPDATSLSADLDPGAYSVALADGWYLEKSVGGIYEPVTAVLLSPESQDFSITEGTTTPVTFQFKAFGELVAIGGSLVVGAEVIEEICDDDFAEQNDNLASAAPVVPSQDYAATICPYDDDYFRVEANAGEFFSASIDFVHADGDLDLYLLDETGVVVDSSTSVTNRESVDSTALTTAVGYIRVIGFQGDAGAYSLTFSSAPAGWTCNELWYNDGTCDCGCGAQETDCDGIVVPDGCQSNSCPAATPNPRFTNYALCSTVPSAWRCNVNFYSDSDCDCGCGTTDPACAGLSLPAQCDFDGCTGATPNVNPADPTQCIP